MILVVHRQYHCLSCTQCFVLPPCVWNKQALGRRGGADDADNVGFSTVSQNFASALQSEEGDIEPPETISYTRIIEKNDG